MEIVDAVQRETALNALLGLCELPMENFTEADRLNFFIHLAGVHSALYILQSGEIQLRDVALEYILQLCGRLADGIRSSESEEDCKKKKAYEQLTRKLVIQALWPGKGNFTYNHSSGAQSLIFSINYLLSIVTCLLT